MSDSKVQEAFKTWASAEDVPMTPEMKALFSGRDSNAGTDPILDTMLAEALSRQDATKEPVDTTRAAREFAREHGWPLPQPFRPKWRRILAVVVGSIIATLLLGQALERLRQTGRETIAPPAPIQALPQPTPARQPQPVFRPVFDPPRAQLVRLPPWRVGEARLVTMPDGRLVVATYRGGVPSMDSLLSRSAQSGDAYWINDSRSLWILTTPIGSSRLSWIDP
jgi:hypothetical protein